MKNVNRVLYGNAVGFIKGANNYVDGGTVRHSMCDEEIYRAKRNGATVVVARAYYDDDTSSMVYFVDEQVLDLYQRLHGYSV